MDLQVANYATVDLLLAAMEARFLPAAAGATARSNYQNALVVSVGNWRAFW